MSIIEFRDFVGVDKKYAPVLAGKMLPDWYRETPGYLGHKSVENATIKKCVPILDSLSMGYLLLLPVDIHVTQKDGYPWYEWDLNFISFHPVEQAEKHPNNNGAPYPKWNNTWCIKTEPGYSCLFISPMHRDLPFKTFEGVVDTDTYNISVKFPFVLKDVSWTGTIPAGTPIVQVIPFKREETEMKVFFDGDKSETTKQFLKLRSQDFNSYKNHFWQRKTFK